MNARTDPVLAEAGVQIIRDASGAPAFVVVPYAQYLRQFGSRPDTIPHAVIERMVGQGISLAKAWREHLGLSMGEVAARLGVTGPAVAQYEESSKLRKATRVRLAGALGIHPEQLDA